MDLANEKVGLNNQRDRDLSLSSVNSPLADNEKKSYSFFMFAFQKDCGLRVIKDLVDGDANLSRIYGFILYTEKDPYVIKVLRDEVFWKSFDCLSGANWPIFAVRPLKDGKMTYKGSGYNDIGFMVNVWDEPKDNLPILQDFGIEDSQELPLFVAFIWNDKDELNSISIPIRGRSIDEVYHSIEEIIKTIADVEAAILPEYMGTVNVFRNVESALKALNFKYKAYNFGKIAKRIGEFLRVFRGIHF